MKARLKKVPMRWKIRKVQPSASGQISPKGEVVPSVLASPKVKKSLKKVWFLSKKTKLQAEIKRINHISEENN